MNKQARKKIKKKLAWTRKSVEAYLTVEASLLLPFILGTLVFIFCIQFYWYNRCLMDQNVAMLGIRAVQEQTVDGEALEQVLNEWEEGYLSDKYYGWEIERPAISLKRNCFAIEQCGKLGYGDRIWKAAVSYENEIIRPAEILRIFRKMVLAEG